MSKERRAIAREIAHNHLRNGDPLGWFEELYICASEDLSIIPWADLVPNPNFISWLVHNKPVFFNHALKIGSALGDDAEELAHWSLHTTAFDISETAIKLCRKRFPKSIVSYVVADLFSAPTEWTAKYDFVLESYTLQVLPINIREDAIRCISSFVAPGGILLVISRGREPNESEGNMPWLLTKDEFMHFRENGLKEVSFEDYIDNEDPPVRRFRVTYYREK